MNRLVATLFLFFVSVTSVVAAEEDNSVSEVPPYASAFLLSSRAKLTERERDALVKELHYCWDKAYKLILQAKSDCQRIKDLNRRQAARSAVEGAIAGFAAARSPIGAAIGAAISTLSNIGGQSFDAIYDAIHHAREAQYWGKRFDEIYYKIQRG